MSLWKKVLLGFAGVIVLLVALFVLLVGPWPVSRSADYENSDAYKEALAVIDKSADKCTFGPNALQAGWAKSSITPPVGTPLAGFGARKGKPSVGVHDDVYVKALALSDGMDTIVIVGSDMLIVPENLAEAVRAGVMAQTPLKAENILLNSSHTHSGPGAWGPGFAGSQIAGAYDEEILNFLTDAFVSAIVKAHNQMGPASLGYGSVDAPEFIRNRTRNAPVDSTLGYLVVEREDDKSRCVLARYSAHPTILGDENMQFTAEYPGYLQRAIEGQTGAFAMYLGGSLGSMGPKAPEAADGFARAALMGEGLAAKVLPNLAGLRLEKNVEIASVGGPIDPPHMQLCINRNLRLSPFALRMLGLDSDAWISGVRIGNLYLVGMPADFSGELSLELHDWARRDKRELWIESFNGDYIGYVSPDRYYLDYKDNGSPGYETVAMSWCGPSAGSYFTDLAKHAVQALAGGPAKEVGVMASGG